MTESESVALPFGDSPIWSAGGGIRTHAPLRTNGFQDRLVMTTSIPLHESGWWESNPRIQLGRLVFYHWTTPAYLIVHKSGWQDSNLRPPGPKPGALAKLSHTPICCFAVSFLLPHRSDSDIISPYFILVNTFLHFFEILKMSTLNSTFFHIFIVLPFCTIRSLFYCIFSLLGSAKVRLPLLPASHAPYFRSYASCFTSSSNSSPAEW